MKSVWTLAAAGMLLAAAPAYAGECANGVCALPTTSVESVLATQAAPSARELQSNVDAYLASSTADASLVGGAGQAGYDGGFWIRGGTFLLKINLTIQTRFEYFDWDDRNEEFQPGGDLSGFSLPRLTLKLSGDATCDVHYYAELEFGHAVSSNLFRGNKSGGSRSAGAIGVDSSEDGYETFVTTAREAWIEYEAAPMLAFRMGLIKTAATRQLMTPPEMQQFVDVSLASAFSGALMPGFTDRNRDYGFMVHGALGCDGEWQYMLTVTNGDGPVRRNVLDGRTDDPLAYSARLNWDILGHMGYEEGALRQRSCEWVASLGAWGHYFIDHEEENTLDNDDTDERISYGVDAAVGWGGFSMTAAYNMGSIEDAFGQSDFYSYLIQIGYLFPDTAWEIAARYSAYSFDTDDDGPAANEIGVAVSYYIDGHADKVTLDAAFISPEGDDKAGNFFAAAYPAYLPTDGSDGLLLRLQWQLAL